MTAIAEQTDLKVTVDRGALLAALDQTARVIPPRTPKPVLMCARLEAGAGLTVTGTNLEHTVRVEVAACEVSAPGVALIPADKLRSIVKESPDATLDLIAQGDVLTVTGRDGRFKVYGQPARDWPDIALAGEDEPVKIGTDELASALGRVAFATAKENSRYAINGVLVEIEGKKATLVATDGHRLALTTLPVAVPPGMEPASFIVPSEGVGLLLDACRRNPEAHAKLRTSGNRVSLALEGYAYTGSLVEGNFPPHKDVIPKDQPIRATVRRETFLSAVRRAALLTNEESKGVRFAFTGRSLVVSSRAPEQGEASVTMEVQGYEGDLLEIGFNPAYLADALKVLDAGDVVLHMQAPNRPLRLEADGFTYVLMPLSLT